jgi:hypothetical protein
LTGIYLYVLLSPGQPQVPSKTRGVVINPDTQDKFNAFVSQFKDYTGSGGFGGGEGGWQGKYDDFNPNDINKEWGAAGHRDDFFLDIKNGQSNGFEEEQENTDPIVPSDKYTCKEGSWVSIRSEMNYKFLWMHTGESMWMGATATMDTPLHRKAFKLVPVEKECEGGGWVLLQEGDSKGFLTMVSPGDSASIGVFVADAWVVKIGTDDAATAKIDTTYHFLLEEDGYVLNKGNMAFVNVMPENEYSVRGHSNGYSRNSPARREYGAMMHFQMVDDKDVQDAIDQEIKEEKEAKEEDLEYIKHIHNFPTSTEKRVISFGLYGAKHKYTTGAIRNAEMAETYFPGWVCRYYHTSDVPQEVLTKLKELGSELVPIPDGQGYVGGMFWRFHVAADESVDRYIVRDTDSRLNSRDR